MFIYIYILYIHIYNIFIYIVYTYIYVYILYIYIVYTYIYIIYIYIFCFGLGHKTSFFVIQHSSKTSESPRKDVFSMWQGSV